MDSGADPVEGLRLDLWGEPESPAGADGPSEPSDTEAAEPGQATPDAIGAPRRLVYGFGYGFRKAVGTAAVAIVSAVLLTMALNQDMTLVDTVNAFVSKIGAFFSSLDI